MPDSPSVISWVSAYKIPLVLAGIGLGCVGLAVFSAFIPARPPESEIVFLDREDQDATESIKVDIAGAVQRPGVYELSEDARIGDAIASAGGFTAGADRTYVAKKLNLAARVSDGGKIFIPEADSSSGMPDPVAAAEENREISVNDASEEELDTLPGVGPVTAQKIIANRPYQRIEELVERKIVGNSVWEKLHDLISL